MLVIAFHGNIEAFKRTEVNTGNNWARVLENVKGTNAVMTGFGFSGFSVEMCKRYIGVFNGDDFACFDIFISFCVST